MMDKILESYPEELLKAFGMNDINITIKPIIERDQVIIDLLYILSSYLNIFISSPTYNSA